MGNAVEMCASDMPSPLMRHVHTQAPLARLLFEAAVLESGFSLDDPKAFSGRVQDLVRGSLGVSPDAQPELDEQDTQSSETSADEAGSESHEEL